MKEIRMAEPTIVQMTSKSTEGHRIYFKGNYFDQGFLEYAQLNLCGTDLMKNFPANRCFRENLKFQNETHGYLDLMPLATPNITLMLDELYLSDKFNLWNTTVLNSTFIFI